MVLECLVADDALIQSAGKTLGDSALTNRPGMRAQVFFNGAVRYRRNNRHLIVYASSPLSETGQAHAFVGKANLAGAFQSGNALLSASAQGRATQQGRRKLRVLKRR